MPRGFPNLAKKIPGKQKDIILAVSQRRHIDTEHAQTVKKIFPEIAFFNHLIQRTICCRNYPAINPDRACPSDPVYWLPVQNVQKFYLHGRRQFANFIKEKSTTARQLQHTWFATFLRAGKGTIFIAKNF